MAKYSFYVRDKKTGQNLYSKSRQPLPLLDFFASQFNNKEELMQFLGVNPPSFFQHKNARKNQKKQAYCLLFQWRPL